MGRWPSKPSQRRPSRNRRGSSAGEFSPVGARHPDVFPINSGKGDPQASRACSAMAILAAPEGAQFEHIGRYGLCFDRLMAFDRDAGGRLSVRDTLFARRGRLARNCTVRCVPASKEHRLCWPRNSDVQWPTRSRAAPSALQAAHWGSFSIWPVSSLYCGSWVPPSWRGVLRPMPWSTTP